MNNLRNESILVVKVNGVNFQIMFCASRQQYKTKWIKEKHLKYQDVRQNKYAQKLSKFRLKKLTSTTGAKPHKYNNNI